MKRYLPLFVFLILAGCMTGQKKAPQESALKKCPAKYETLLKDFIYPPALTACYSKEEQLDFIFSHGAAPKLSAVTPAAQEVVYTAEYGEDKLINKVIYKSVETGLSAKIINYDKEALVDVITQLNPQSGRKESVIYYYPSGMVQRIESYKTDLPYSIDDKIIFHPNGKVETYYTYANYGAVNESFTFDDLGSLKEYTLFSMPPDAKKKWDAYIKNNPRPTEIPRTLPAKNIMYDDFGRVFQYVVNKWSSYTNIHADEVIVYNPGGYVLKYYCGAGKCLRANGGKPWQCGTQLEPCGVSGSYKGYAFPKSDLDAAIPYLAPDHELPNATEYPSVCEIPVHKFQCK